MHCSWTNHPGFTASVAALVKPVCREKGCWRMSPLHQPLFYVDAHCLQTGNGVSGGNTIMIALPFEELGAFVHRTSSPICSRCVVKRQALRCKAYVQGMCPAHTPLKHRHHSRTNQPERVSALFDPSSCSACCARRAAAAVCRSLALRQRMEALLLLQQRPPEAW